MRFIADFHLHSKYSRATSREMDVDHIAQWAKWKGLNLVGTGDFTHHLWLSELKEKLKPKGNGLFIYQDVHFILTSEVNNIFSQGGRSHRVHNVIFAPSIEVVERINRSLSGFGNLASDGRPIISLSCRDLLEELLSISQDCLLVPGHIWTPHFSLFGSNSGFDSIEECFGNLSREIYALETGLSSDPAMNWRLSRHDKLTFISNSDAHSPSRLAREANIFEGELDYKEIINTLKEKDQKKLVSTIEFFPQEGKYHFDGHRSCNLCLSPQESKKHNNVCPQCGGRLTIGVMHRLDDLADREYGFEPEGSIPFYNLIPLEEIIAESLGKSRGTETVSREYHRIISHYGNEIRLLLDIPSEDLNKLPSQIKESILRVREGKVEICPGYDGVYGRIKIFAEGEKIGPEQMGLF